MAFYETLISAGLGVTSHWTMTSLSTLFSQTHLITPPALCGGRKGEAAASLPFTGALIGVGAALSMFSPAVILQVSQTQLMKSLHTPG